MSNSESIASSTRFRAVFENVALVAPVDSAVLTRAKPAPARKVTAQAILEARFSPQQWFRVSQLRGDPIRWIRWIRGIRAIHRWQHHNLASLSFVSIHLEMAGALLHLGSIVRSNDVVQMLRARAGLTCLTNPVTSQPIHE